MNVQDIDLNLLRVFDTVLSERGVTPAAARLGLTQPAVSNALARLRGAFGDALFVRTPGGMDPTPFARELAEPVRQALALLESALAHGPGFDPATSTRAFRFYCRTRPVRFPAAAGGARAALGAGGRLCGGLGRRHRRRACAGTLYLAAGSCPARVRRCSAGAVPDRSGLMRSDHPNGKKLTRNSLGLLAMVSYREAIA